MASLAATAYGQDQPGHPSWVGRTALGRQEEKIGTITDVYVDDQTNEPEWLAVTTGLLGARVSFVPLHGAIAQGNEVRLPFSKDQVKDAPDAEPDVRLSMEEEARLYQYWGLSYGDALSDSGLPAFETPAMRRVTTA